MSNHTNNNVLKKGQPPKEMETGLLSIKDLLNEAVATKKIPGGALLLAHKSEIIFEEYVGVSDLQTGRPFTQDTIKLLASSTKPIAVSTIMTLVDEGKLNLIDPISKYLPEFSEFTLSDSNEKVAAPTVWQCLSMTSGMFGMLQATPYQHCILRQPELTLADTARLILKEKLAKKPGSFFAYSGSSFQVAGYIAELLSGLPFEELTQSRICVPLGMKDTMFANQIQDDEQWDRLDTVYLPDGKGAFNTLVKLPRNRRQKLVLLGGGMVGTCRDYLTFLQMHLNRGSYGSRQILSSNSVDEMRKVRTIGIDRDRGMGQIVDEYGLGWFVMATDNQGLARVYRHGGQWGTTGWIDRDRELVAFWATNVPSAVVGPLLVKIYNKVQEIIPGPKSRFTIQDAPVTAATEPPVIDLFTVEPEEIIAGEKATLSWFITGLEINAELKPSVGNLGSFTVGATQNKGIFHVSPGSTTKYTLTASNPVGEVSKTVTLKVI